VLAPGLLGEQPGEPVPDRGDGDGEPSWQSNCTLLAFCDMKTLYLRNVPDDVSERLASLAAREGLSLSAVSSLQPRASANATYVAS
jgi:hypothetical protein